MSQAIVGSLFIIIIIIAAWLAAFYNRMTNIKIKVDDSWAQIHAQLGKRDDLLRIYKVFIISELNPEVKANIDLLQLKGQLEEFEEKIEKYVCLYNNAVRIYNNFVRTFPNNIAGMILGVKELSLLQADSMERAVQ